MKYEALTSARVEDRHHALDLLRGLAALGVASYHFLFYGAGVDVQSLGTFTVYLFFSLSALAMMMVYGARFSLSIDRRNLIAFYRARAARIVPLLALVSLVAAVIAHSWTASARAILTGSGAFALGPPGMLSVGNGAWSLGIELAFYLVFPAVALVAGRWRTRTLLGLLAALIVAQQVHLWLISEWVVADPVLHWRLYISPITFAPFFLIGFIVYRLRAGRGAWAGAAMLLLLAATAGFSLLWSGNLFSSSLAYLAATALMALTLLAAWRAGLPAAAVPLATFAGEISYSLYLTHWFAFVAVERVLVGMPAGVRFVAFIGVAIPGAWLCYALFERPLRQRIGVRRPVGG